MKTFSKIQQCSSSLCSVYRFCFQTDTVDENEEKNLQKEEDHESPITLTLEEEEKIQDDEVS